MRSSDVDGRMRTAPSGGAVTTRRSRDRFGDLHPGASTEPRPRTRAGSPLRAAQNAGPVTWERPRRQASDERERARLPARRSLRGAEIEQRECGATMATSAAGPDIERRRRPRGRSAANIFANGLWTAGDRWRPQSWDPLWCLRCTAVSRGKSNLIAKVRVAGSNPVVRSRISLRSKG
jgi:hypothetical protein